MVEQRLQERIGVRIKRRRAMLGLNQGELAARAQMPQEHISRIERGAWQAINPERLVAIVDALRTSLDYLFCRSNDPGPFEDRCPAPEAALAGALNPWSA